ncbi:MAG: hypothetical protein AAFN65_06205 [Bacteroidota bacterium]
MLRHLNYILIFIFLFISCSKSTKVPVETYLLEAASTALLENIQAEEERYDMAFNSLEEQLSMFTHERFSFILEMHRQLLNQRNWVADQFWSLTEWTEETHSDFELSFEKFREFEESLDLNMEELIRSIVEILDRHKEIVGLDSSEFIRVSQNFHKVESELSVRTMQGEWNAWSQEERMLKVLTLCAEAQKIYRDIEFRMYMFCIRTPHFTEAYFPLIIDREQGCLQSGDTLQFKVVIAEYQRLVKPEEVVLVIDNDTCALDEDGFQHFKQVVTERGRQQMELTSYVLDPDTGITYESIGEYEYLVE